MSDEAKKTEKTSWFQGLKAEFKNISWPDRKIAYQRDNYSNGCIRCPGCHYCYPGYGSPVWN